jgi:hypothetical protein
MKYLLPNGMTVDENGMQVLPDPQSPETAERVSQVILASGINIGAEAEKVMSRDTANDQGSEDVEDVPATQSVNEVHAPSGEEWYYQRAQELQNEHPDWTPDQITNKMSEIVWDNNYQSLMDRIANSSSPGERELLIREHQVELDKYKASGLEVDKRITALRNESGMPSIMIELGEYGQSEQYQKDQAIVNEWQRRVDSGQRLNIDFDQTYQYEVNAAAIRVNLYNGFQVVQKYGFFDDLISKLYADHMRWGYAATLTKQDQYNGYRLDYFPDVDAKLRVRSDNDIHPDDLIMYHEHLKNATNSWEKELTKGTMVGTLGLGEPDGSGWTQFGYHLTKDAPKIDLAVSTLWGGYGLSKSLGFAGHRAVLSSESLGDKIGSEGTGEAKYTYNMIENPGPLAEMKENPAANFSSGKYNTRALTEEAIYYRSGKSGGKTVEGQEKNAFGQYFTRQPADSVAQVRIDSAVKMHWINPKTGFLEGTSPIESTYAIKFPAGTTVYEGPVGYQGGIYLGGEAFEQIFIPKAWDITGVKVLSETPIK